MKKEKLYYAPLTRRRKIKMEIEAKRERKIITEQNKENFP